MLITRCRFALILLLTFVGSQAQALPVVLEGHGSAGAPLVAIDDRDGADRLTDVNTLLHSGEYDAAVDRAKAVIAEDPECGLAYEVLGTAEILAGRTDQGAEALRRAMELDPDQSGPRTKLGSIAMEAGEIEAAEALLRGAIQVNPEDRFAHQRLGLLYEYLERDAEAIEHLQQGLAGTSADYLGVAVNLGRLLNEQQRFEETVRALEPRLPLATGEPAEAQFILGIALLGIDAHDRALPRFERFIELRPDSPEGKRALGITLRRAGRHTEALQVFEALATDHPRWSESYIEIGETRLQQDLLPRAMAAFEQAQRLGADRSNIDMRLARYHIGRGELEEAAEAFDRITSSDRAYPARYAEYAEVLLAAGEPDRGVAVLRDGIGRFADDVYLHFRLGNYLASIQRYEEAVPVLERAAAMAPEDPAVLRALSLAQSRSGEAAAAAETAGRLHATVRRPETSIFYAMQLENAGELRKAETLYREVLAGDSDNVLVLNNLANVLAELDELDEAELMARRAVALSDGNGRLMDTLGWVLYRQRRYDEAAHMLKQASEREPEVAIIHYHRGLVLSELGSREPSREALTRALQIDGGASWADDALARLNR